MTVEEREQKREWENGTATQPLHWTYWLLGADGKQLATASGPSIKRWDTTTFQEVAAYLEDGPITSLAFSPDEKVLAVVGLTAALVAPTAAVAGSRLSGFPPRGGETISVLPAGQDNPSIANGVAIGPEAAIYKTSGLGPSRLRLDPLGARVRHVGGESHFLE